MPAALHENLLPKCSGDVYGLCLISMESAWSQHGYEIVFTEDGSPTLHWINSETKEFMHHRGGAYTETQLIYGNPLRESLKAGGRSAISVGLGLGYNEMMVAVECLKNQISPRDFRMLSFESELILRERFLKWLEFPEDFQAYDLLANFFLKGEVFTLFNVKSWLLDSLNTGTWVFEKALETNYQFTQRYAVIFYDAFSSKTTPHLWEEDFLKLFFEQGCEPRALISSFSCQANFKRALKANGFEVVLREGFKSKRPSTLGIRNNN